MSELISMNQAVRQGTARLRDPKWADPEDYVRIDILESGDPGPWVHLFARRTQAILNQRTPMDLLFTAFDWNAEDAVPYTGPLDEADTEGNVIKTPAGAKL